MKEKTSNNKLNAKVVGVDDPVRPIFEELTANKKSSKSYSKLTSDHRGITLIALIITIIVMLILVAVTVSVALNEGLFKTAKEAAENTQLAKDKESALSGGRVKVGDTWYDSLDKYLAGEKSKNQSDVPGEESQEGEWTQDKITVTNGAVTLTVGQPVTGYKVNVDGKEIGDGNWFVLGAEDGKLLITTNTNQEEITLEGKEGYVNGVKILNEAGAKYSDGNMAESARSINVEDINRVTGYDPKLYIENSGLMEGTQYGDKVTFTLNTDGYIYVKTSKNQDIGLKTRSTSFEYWDSDTDEWLQLTKENPSVTVTYETYTYYPQTFSLDDVSGEFIYGLENSVDAYKLLFANTNPPGGRLISYWLASRCSLVATDDEVNDLYEIYDGLSYALRGVRKSRRVLHARYCNRLGIEPFLFTYRWD